VQGFSGVVARFCRNGLRRWQQCLLTSVTPQPAGLLLHLHTTVLPLQVSKPQKWAHRIVFPV
jgi:hypothetical protein